MFERTKLRNSFSEKNTSKESRRNKKTSRNVGIFGQKRVWDSNSSISLAKKFEPSELASEFIVADMETVYALDSG